MLKIASAVQERIMMLPRELVSFVKNITTKEELLSVQLPYFAMQQ